MICKSCNAVLPVTVSNAVEYMSVLDMSGWKVLRNTDPITQIESDDHVCEDCFSLLQHPALKHCTQNPINTLQFFHEAIPFLVLESL